MNDAAGRGNDSGEGGATDSMTPGDGGCAGAPSMCERRAVHVSSGAYGACAVLEDGTLWCWGKNHFGEVGTSTVGNPTCANDLCVPRPTQVSGLPSIVQVSVGFQFACAVDTLGRVWCWGKNHRLQLGHDNASDPKDTGGEPYDPVPWPVAPLPPAARVACGTEIACAVSTVGGVWCWGNGGDPVRENLFDVADSGVDGAAADIVATPVAAANLAAGVDGLSLPATYLGTLASDHLCAHKADGTVWCWGDDFFDDRGSTAPGGSLATAVLRPDGAVATGLGPPSAGINASCAVLDGGALGCWGDDTGGYFANGGAGSGKAVPALSPANQGGPELVSVSGSSANACGIAPDRSLYCWGLDDMGQMGDGVILAGVVGSATRVPGFAALEVSSSRGFTVAIRDDGTLWAWGDNTYGELGHPPGAPDTPGCTGAQTFCVPSPAQVVPSGSDGGP